MTAAPTAAGAAGAQRLRAGPWLWLLVWLVAFGLSQLVPPMQSPDENSHIARADTLTRGQWLLGLQAGSLGTGSTVDEGLLTFIDIHMRQAAHPGRRLDPAERAQADAARWTGRERYAAIPGTGYYLPFVYAPQALGLGLGRALDLDIATSYQLARAATLLACVALLAAAVRVLPPNPFVVAVLLLPMSLFQLLSPTLDGVTACLALLLLALFLAGWDRGRPFGAAASATLAAGLLLLAGSRIHLLPLLALPLWLAWRRRSRRDLVLGLLAAAASLAWVMIALRRTVDLRIPRQHSTAELVTHYVTQPLEFFRVVGATLAHDETRDFYLTSFVGNLGWLDTPLAPGLYPWLWTGLGLAALLSLRWRPGSGDLGARLWLLASALACAALTFFALLVAWTPHPAVLVGGIQGRYFIVPALVAGHALSGLAAAAAWRPRGLAGPAVAAFALLSGHALVTTLLARYH